VYEEGGECAADITVTISIDRKYNCPRPLVETKDSLICLAGRGNLFDSIKLAVQDMTSLLFRLYGITEKDAYVLCTTVGSIRIGACVCNRESTENRCLVGISVPKSLNLSYIRGS